MPPGGVPRIQPRLLSASGDFNGHPDPSADQRMTMCSAASRATVNAASSAAASGRSRQPR
jgi:hypothetical protein